jgi:uncharacterized protein
MVDVTPLLLLGFVAQLVDGALGMAYGTISSLSLLMFGFAPATASAIVHSAEVFTCSASGLAHYLQRNVDWRIVTRLAPAGIIGAFLGATTLSHVDGDTVRPFIAAYLAVLGILILRHVRNPVGTSWVWREHVLIPLGFVGGLLDSLGGGWGPVVTSTLLCAGHDVRKTIGSVIVAEAAVAITATLTFTAFLGAAHWPAVVALIIGGLLAAPFGAYAVRHIPRRPLLAMVGTLVVVLSGVQFWRILAT